MLLTKHLDDLREARIQGLVEDLKSGKVAAADLEAAVAGVNKELKNQPTTPLAAAGIAQGYEENTEALKRYRAELQNVTEAVGGHVNLAQQVVGLNKQQRSSMLALVQGAESLGGELSDLQKQQVANLLAAGDFRGALQHLKGVVDENTRHLKNLASTHQQAATAAEEQANKAEHLGKALSQIPSKVTSKVTTPGLNTALSQAQAFQNLMNSLDGRVVTTIIQSRNVKQGGMAAGGIAGLGLGGIPHAAPGMIVKSPTLLVGEGRYSTPFGRGTEGVIPFDSRGIGILSQAIGMALGKLLGNLGGSSRQQAPIVVPVVFERDLQRYMMNLSAHQAMRRAGA